MFPLRTNIPLATLNTTIEDTFPNLDVRAANCLQNAGITCIWQLLVQCEASMLKTKNFGRESLKHVREALASKGWKFGGFNLPYNLLTKAFSIKGLYRSFSIIDAIGRNGASLAAECDEVAPLLTEHGLHANMTIDELFVYVPTERPPLTEEQVAFLRTWPQHVFTNTYELTWCQVCFNLMKRDRVLDIALMLPHLRADDEHKETIARIRARIEAEVGPLPLALTTDELHALR